MKCLVLLAVVAVAHAGYLGSSVQTRTQDAFGNYNFGYREAGATGGTARSESRNAAGVVTGSYALSVGDGRQRVVNYVADAAGFRANVQTNEPGVDPSRDPAATLVNKAGIVAPAAIAAPAIAAPAIAAPAIAAPAIAAPLGAISYSSAVAHGAALAAPAAIAAPLGAAYSTAINHAAPIGYAAPLGAAYSTAINHAGPIGYAAPLGAAYSTAINHAGPIGYAAPLGYAGAIHKKILL